MSDSENTISCVEENLDEEEEVNIKTTRRKTYSCVSDSDRVNAKNILKINKRTVFTLEKQIYEQYKGNLNMYNMCMYQIYWYIQQKTPIDVIKKVVKEKKLGFNHSDFNKEKYIQTEYKEYLIKPFEVVKGLLKCPKCKNDETMSYSKNDRAGDEAMSVYATCFNCKHSWRENN